MSILVAGHRGVAGTHPENTSVSIQQALKLGLKWIEVDVQPTKDDVLVVCHDHTVDRCSNGKGRIDEMTLDTLTELDFGGWKSPEFKGEKIMTLRQLLTFCHEHLLCINIEVKVDRHDAKHVVQLLKKELGSTGFDREKMIISSFSQEVMLEAHHANLGTRLGVLGNRFNRKVMATIRDVNAFSCHLNYRWLTQRHIRKMREMGVEIWCYTVNNPKAFKHLNDVDAIFSDYPSRFLAAKGEGI